MSELGKPFPKNQIKNKKINVKVPHVNKKPLARNGNSVQTKKLDLERTMSELGKLFPKIRSKMKKPENQCQKAACEQNH